MMYEVDIFYQGIYTVRIHAEDKDTAEQKALERFDDADWPRESCPHMMGIDINEYTKADYKKDVGV